MRRILLILSIVLLIMISCEGELPFILTRSDSDPSDSIISVKAVMEENRGYFSLEWEEDKGADSYIVMRAEDDAVLSFEKIYEGTDTCFRDTEFESKTAYVYRLDKVRGEKVFAGSKYSYGYYYGGVGRILSRDSFEDNDSIEKAKRMDGTIEANLYAVKFNTGGKLLYDEDWYYLTVPAGYTAAIKINQTYRTIGSGNTDLRIYISTRTSDDEIVVQNGTYSLQNNTTAAQDIYFRITADMQTLLEAVPSGDVLIDYRIQLDHISQ